MKKLLTGIILLVLVMSTMLGVLAACADPTDYDHTIVLYTSQGDKLQKQTDNAIASFEAKFPGWKVIHTTQKNYDATRDKIRQDFSARSYPDLAYCYPDHVALYFPTGKVVNMSNYINSSRTVKGVDKDGAEVDYRIGFTDEELADFEEIFLNEGQAKNWSAYDQYGFKPEDIVIMPFVRSTEILYYNKTALDACGLSVPTTWDDLWAQNAIVSAKYPKATLLGYDSEANWFITKCEQNGWGYTSTNENNHFLFKENEALANWLDDIGEKYDAGYVTTQNTYGSYTSTLFTNGPKAYTVEGGKIVAKNGTDTVEYANLDTYYASQEGIVYCVGSSGGASYQATSNFEWGVAPIPGEKNGNNHVISQGPSFVMFSGGHKVSNAEEKEKMTFLFLKEFLEPKFQASFAIVSGYSPVRTSTYSMEAYTEFLATKKTDIVAAVLDVSAGIRDRFYISPAFKGSSTARDVVGATLVRALKQEVSGADNLIRAYKDCGGK